MKYKLRQADYILVDTDVWVGFILADDPHHAAASKLLSQIRKQRGQLVITTDVVAETITVLSHKSGQGAARSFLRLVDDPDLIRIPTKEKFFIKALGLFAEQDKKGTSYVDCMNVVVMAELEFDKILSFDKVYHNRFGLQNLAYTGMPKAA